MICKCRIEKPGAIINDKLILLFHNKRTRDHIMQSLFFLRKTGHDITNKENHA